MFSVRPKPYHAFLNPVNEFKHSLRIRTATIPIDKNHIHCELVREENVHQKQGRDVKNDTDPENPPADAPPKNRERKEQLPDEYEPDSKRQVLLHLRQPERRG